MTYRREPPTCEGYYWCGEWLEPAGLHPRWYSDVVFVSLCDGQMQAHYDDELVPVTDEETFGRSFWAGPIPEPAEPCPDETKETTP